MKKKIPDECTSLGCLPDNHDYCPKCSHAIFKGATNAAGQLLTWEYSPQFGPEFNIDLPENHKGWDLFYEWLERHF